VETKLAQQTKEIAYLRRQEEALQREIRELKRSRGGSVTGGGAGGGGGGGGWDVVSPRLGRAESMASPLSARAQPAHVEEKKDLTASKEYQKVHFFFGFFFFCRPELTANQLEENLKNYKLNLKRAKRANEVRFFFSANFYVLFFFDPFRLPNF
jgi:hypothetical protein